MRYSRASFVGTFLAREIYTWMIFYDELYYVLPSSQNEINIVMTSGNHFPVDSPHRLMVYCVMYVKIKISVNSHFQWDIILILKVTTV